jgi:hypothetical protein
MNTITRPPVYPVVAGLCAFVLVGGGVAALLVAGAPKSPRPPRPDSANVLADAPSASLDRLPAAPRNRNGRPDRTDWTPEDDLRVPEPRFLPTQDEEPAPESAPQPTQIPGEKAEPGAEPEVAKLPARDEKVVKGVEDFIKKELQDTGGIEIVASTLVETIPIANGKLATVVRVVFRANNALGQSVLHDFLFVLQKNQVINYARTLEFIAAENARRARMLELAFANQAAAQRQMQALAATGNLIGRSGSGWNPRGYQPSHHGEGSAPFQQPHHGTTGGHGRP